MKVGEKTNLGRLATIFRILGDLPQYFKFVRWMLTSLKFLPLQSENNVWKCFDIFTKARYPLPKMNKMAAQNNENKNGNQRKSYPKFFFYRSLSLKFCVVCFGIGKYVFLLLIVFLRFFSTSTCSSSKIRPSLPIFKLGNSSLSPFQKFIIVFTERNVLPPTPGKDYWVLH